MISSRYNYIIEGLEVKLLSTPIVELLGNLII